MEMSVLAQSCLLVFALGEGLLDLGVFVISLSALGIGLDISEKNSIRYRLREIEG